MGRQALELCHTADSSHKAALTTVTVSVLRTVQLQFQFQLKMAS